MWNHIPMDNTNKTLAVHALVTLAICYFPGVIAGLWFWINLMSDPYKQDQTSHYVRPTHSNWPDTENECSLLVCSTGFTCIVIGRQNLLSCLSNYKTFVQTKASILTTRPFTVVGGGYWVHICNIKLIANRQKEDRPTKKADWNSHFYLLS